MKSSKRASTECFAFSSYDPISRAAEKSVLHENWGRSGSTRNPVHFQYVSVTRCYDVTFRRIARSLYYV